MLRKSFCTFSLFVLFALPLSAQTGIRWDLGAPGSAGAVTIGGTGLSPVLALPGVQLNWCSHPANAVPCTNYATTYPSSTAAGAGTPTCGNTTQIVLQGSSTCQATGDNFGNMGVWTATNTSCGNLTCYDYTLTANGVSYGPFVWYGAGTPGSGGFSGSCATLDAVALFTGSMTLACSNLIDNGDLTYTFPTSTSYWEITPGNVSIFDQSSDNDSYGCANSTTCNVFWIAGNGSGGSNTIAANGFYALSGPDSVPHAFYLSRLSFSNLGTPREQDAGAGGQLSLNICGNCDSAADGAVVGAAATSTGGLQHGNIVAYDAHTTTWLNVWGKSGVSNTYACGTTTTCSATVQAGAKIVQGKVTLSGGTATVSSLPAFTSTSTFNCTASDTTTATDGANAVPASTTSITVTGNSTDVVSYICLGN